MSRTIDVNLELTIMPASGGHPARWSSSSPLTRNEVLNAIDFQLERLHYRELALKDARKWIDEGSRQA